MTLANEQCRQLIEDASALAEGLARYLASKFDVGQGFPSREFYATAFASWLWSYYPARFSSQIQAAFELLRRVEKPQKGPNRFHWEFVRFAVSNALLNLQSKKSAKQILGKEHFAYTRVANWTLLRSTTRLLGRGVGQATLAFFERIGALLYYQRPWGLIEDERERPSLQYHAFSTALLGLQVCDCKVRDRFTRKRFLKALEVLDLLTLPGGQCNYWGRGQGQAFGYAAAILAFALGACITGEAYYIRRAHEVLGYVKRYVRLDGSLPLVLRPDEPPDPLRPNLLDPRFLGWYSYNNYFDYLAFVGALLAKTATLVIDVGDQLCRFATQRPTSLRRDELLGGDVRIHSSASYTAVVTRPFGSLAATLAMPYLCVQGRYPLPCYGGEEFGSLYTTRALPFPIVVDRYGNRYSLYELLRFQWVGHDIIEGKGPTLVFLRHFQFGETRIAISDEIRFRGHHEGWMVKTPRFLLYKNNYERIATDRLLVDSVLLIQADRPLVLERERHYCSMGELVAFHGEPVLIADDNAVVKSWIWIEVIGT